MITNNYSETEKCVDDVIKRVGKDIVLGTPLALGKANHFVNALYKRAKKDSSIKLKILTALTLGKPPGASLLEKRFIGPFGDRVFDDYPSLLYAQDREKGKLPKNIQVVEFYYPAGKLMGCRYAQENYVSCNYTHVFRDMMDHGINVLAQLVSKQESEEGIQYSLSCNSDVTVDLVPKMLESETEERKVAFVAEVNNNLPFMYGDALVPESFFTHIVDNEADYFKLFGPPKMAVSDADFLVGLHASTLVKDGGCIQVGIGALGDAFNYGLILRQKNNEDYQSMLKSFQVEEKFGPVIEKLGGKEKFEQGLFGATEMFVDGFMDLYEAGILVKKAYNNVALQRLVNEGKISGSVEPNILDLLLSEGAIREDLCESQVEFLKEYGIFKDEVEFENGQLILLSDPMRVTVPADLSDLDVKDKVIKNFLGDKLKNGHVVHGGFFLGPNKFYDWLNKLSEEERKQFFMTSVGKINQLYWTEEIDCLQRQNARFVNTGLYGTLSGAICSDGLEDGEIISGVGGQYNFVAMAHEIPGGRSVIKLRSTRKSKGKLKSNIMWNYGHITIPRHLRDIVVTEYGIANLRGKTDSEIIKELLNITDSNFQKELLAKAKEHGKIEKNYKIPKEFQSNYAHILQEKLKPYKELGYFEKFPFGTDFTEEEIIIGGALKKLKKAMEVNKLGIILSNLFSPKSSKGVESYLERMKLLNAKGFKEKFMRKLLIRALKGEFS